MIPSSSTLNLPSTDEAPLFSIEGVASARKTLLLGLRLLPTSHRLWLEYIKLELGWVEGLRRRWNVLSIRVPDPPDGADVDPENFVGGEGSFGPDGENARRAILSGQLAIQAISSALEAISPEADNGMAFRKDLLKLTHSYPSTLRLRCSQAVYTELDNHVQGESPIAAEAFLLRLTRGLRERPYTGATSTSDLGGETVVKEIGLIGLEIRKHAKSGGPAFGEVAGSWLVEQMALHQDNENLVSIVNPPQSTGLRTPAEIPTLHAAIPHEARKPSIGEASPPTFKS